MSPTVAVSELWRYPVKSMGGEPLTGADVGERGIVGDRVWAVRDETTGAITGAKKIPRLMLCTARFLDEPEWSDGEESSPPVAIRLPNGDELRSDRSDVHERLSSFLEREVTLCERRPASDREHYRAQPATGDELRQQFALEAGEPWPDMSMLPVSLLAQLARFATPPGTYFDAYPLHILSTGSLHALSARAPDSDFSARRFRPNIVLDAGEGGERIERTWSGASVSVGSLVMRIEIPTVRCSMIMRAQPGLKQDREVLRTVAESGRLVGSYGHAEQPGRIELGQTVSQVVIPESSRMSDLLNRAQTALKRNLLRAVMPKKSGTGSRF